MERENGKADNAEHGGEDERRAAGYLFCNERAVLRAFHTRINIAVDIIIEHAPRSHHERDADERGEK